MLNLDHPQSKHIFAASNLEDFILERAKLMTLVPSARRRELLGDCEPKLAAMRDPNKEHFENSKVISEAIDDLARRLNQLANLGNGQVTSDHSNGEGNCSVCGTAIKNFVFVASLPREIYCGHCLDIVMPAIEKLRSEDGFGTWAI
jgi:hypothetical protein